MMRSGDKPQDTEAATVDGSQKVISPNANMRIRMPEPALQQPAKPLPDIIGLDSTRTPDRPHPYPTSLATQAVADPNHATVPARTSYHSHIPSNARPPSAALPNTPGARSHVTTNDDQVVVPRAGTPQSPSANTGYAPSVMTASTLPPSYRTRGSGLDFADDSTLPRYSAAGLSGPPSFFSDGRQTEGE